MNCKALLNIAIEIALYKCCIIIITTLTLLYPGKQLHHVLKFVAIISTMPLLLSFFQINKDLQDGRESVLP